ncbi:MAG: hypothetical protein Q4C30_08680, partial [Bacteroidia bacterium]|nr:hypothetical protein [Bacteroidia bacterium]
DITVNRTIATGRIYYMGSATKEGGIEANDWTRTNLYYMYADLNAQKFVARHNTPSFVKYGSGTIVETSTTMGCTRTSTPNVTFTQKGTVSRVEEISGVPTYKGTSWYSNPYPFSLELSENTLMFANGNAVQESVYARTYSNGSWGYETYNMKNKVSNPSTFKALAPFQAFAVLSKGEVPTQMTVSPKVSQNAAQLKSASIDMTTGNVLRLNVALGKYSDELALLLNEEGELTQGDGDSEKMADTSAKVKIVTNKGGKSLVISHFPSAEQLSDEGIVIPIEISKAAISGDLVISANIDDFYYDGKIILLDNLTGEEIDLKATEAYTCTNLDNLYAGRFSLMFENVNKEENETQTGGTDIISESDKLSIGLNENGKVCVTFFGNIDEDAEVSVYDMFGRVVCRVVVNERVNVFDIHSKGVVIVRVKNGSINKSEKVLL